METIEERAINYTYKECILKLTDVAKESYEAGAKEQKAIDDTNLQERFQKVLNGQKLDLIEKAWSLAEAIYQVGKDHLTPLTKDEFIKAMEE